MTRVIVFTPRQVRKQEDAFAAVVADALHTVAVRASLNVHNVLVAAGGPAVGAAPTDVSVISGLWSNVVAVELAPLVGDAYQHGALETEMAIGAVFESLDFEPMSDVFVDQYIKNATNRLVGIGDELWQAARESLAEGIALGETIPQLRDRVVATAGVTEKRANVIARTEVISASNAGSLQQVMITGLTGTKEWLATNDERTRCTHRAAGGQTAALDGTFTLGGNACGEAAASLQFPGDPTGPPGEVIQCRCSMAFDLSFDEEPLVAAAEVHTGAMIALRMTEPDARVMEVEGGEDADELHVTLCYLGDATALTEQYATSELIDHLAEVAETYAKIHTETFALDIFNPESDEYDTAVVLGVRGTPGMLEIQEAVYDCLGKLDVEYPDQHEPWIPHITLAYTDDLGRALAWTDRIGPIIFDRIRLAIAGMTWDFPLGVPLTAAGKHEFDESKVKRDNHGQFAKKAGFGDAVKFLAYLDEQFKAGTLKEGSVLGNWKSEGEKRRLILTTDTEGNPGIALQEIMGSKWENVSSTYLHDVGSVKAWLNDAASGTDLAISPNALLPAVIPKKSSGSFGSHIFDLLKDAKPDDILFQHQTEYGAFERLRVRETPNGDLQVEHEIDWDGDGKWTFKNVYNNADDLDMAGYFAGVNTAKIGAPTPTTNSSGGVDATGFDPNDIGFQVAPSTPIAPSTPTKTVPKLTNAVIYGKYADGEVIATSGDGFFKVTFKNGKIHVQTKGADGNWGTGVAWSKGEAYKKLQGADNGSGWALGDTPVIDTPMASVNVPAPVPAVPDFTAQVLAGDFSQLKQVGPQGGSNPGGIFEAPDGSRWYVKTQKSEKHAKNEEAAAALYREAGIDVPQVIVGSGIPMFQGKTQTATRIVPGAKTDLSSHLGDEAYLAKLRRGFAVDAWLADWDVIGLNFDNVVTDENGNPIRIDVGGSMLFRAQGTPKGDKFGDTVPEWDTLRSPSQGPQAAKVFGDMTPEQLAESVKLVEDMTPEKIHAIIHDKKLADKLIARREDLLKRAAKESVLSTTAPSIPAVPAVTNLTPSVTTHTTAPKVPKLTNAVIYGKYAPSQVVATSVDGNTQLRAKKDGSGTIVPYHKQADGTWLASTPMSKADTYKFAQTKKDGWYLGEGPTLTAEELAAKQLAEDKAKVQIGYDVSGPGVPPMATPTVDMGTLSPDFTTGKEVNVLSVKLMTGHSPGTIIAYSEDHNTRVFQVDTPDHVGIQFIDTDTGQWSPMQVRSKKYLANHSGAYAPDGWVLEGVHKATNTDLGAAGGVTPVTHADKIAEITTAFAGVSTHITASLPNDIFSKSYADAQVVAYSNDGNVKVLAFNKSSGGMSFAVQKRDPDTGVWGSAEFHSEADAHAAINSMASGWVVPSAPVTTHVPPIAGGAEFAAILPNSKTKYILDSFFFDEPYSSGQIIAYSDDGFTRIIQTDAPGIFAVQYKAFSTDDWSSPATIAKTKMVEFAANQSNASWVIPNDVVGVGGFKASASVPPPVKIAPAGVLTPAVQDDILTAFTSSKVKWSTAAADILDLTVKKAHEHGLSLADVLTTMDATTKTSTSKTPYTDKIVKFLGTPGGKIKLQASASSSGAFLTKSSKSTISTLKPVDFDAAKVVTPAYTPSSSLTSAKGKASSILNPDNPKHPVFSPSTALSMQKEMHAQHGSWTATQQAKLKKYTGSAYKAINTCLRKPTTCIPGNKDDAKQIQAGMRPTTRSFRVFRGTDTLGEGIKTSDLPGLVGKTITDSAFMSTTVDPTGGFSGPLRLVVDVPVGTPAAWVGHISLHPSENELLLASGLKYRVTAVEHPADTGLYYTIIRMEVVP